jgi:hypothetical protein
MEYLPYDLRFHLATLLNPPDIRALCLTCNAFARLSTDENLFCMLYHRDFLPHIKCLNDADMSNAITMARSENHDQERERVVERAATKEQVEILRSNPKIEEKTWKELYFTLYGTKQGMLSEIRTIFSLPSPTSVHKCGVNNFLIYQSNPHSKEAFYFSCGHISTCDLIISESQFSPDIAAFDLDFTYTEILVRMRDLSVFHQIRLINKCQDVNQYINYNEEDPPNGWAFACVVEGICCWSKNSQQYHLIYPMCSLRRLFLQCRDQVLLECDEKLLPIKRLLKQVTTFTYTINHNDISIFKRNPALVQNALESYLGKWDFKIKSVEFDDDNSTSTSETSMSEGAFSKEKLSMTLTCSCEPPLRYSDGMCIGDYCTKNAVEKGPETNALWRDKYCEDHGPQDTTTTDDYLDDLRLRESSRRSELLQHFSERNVRIRKHLCFTIKDALDGEDKEIHLKRISVVVSK